MVDCGEILVVDDDQASRALVRSLLERAGFRMREAATGVEALDLVRRNRPALVLLEIGLPDVNGYEVCRALRDEFGEQLPIVFLSQERTDALDRVAGLLIGADDYIVKPFDPDEFVVRVRGLATRSRERPPEDGTPIAALLTKREREVLVLLAKGLRHKKIAQELFISPKTVATHIQRILTKLGVHNRAEAVALAYREGLVDVDGVAAQASQRTPLG